MRVLILWAEVNGSRARAAIALAEQFSKLNVEYEIVDALSFFSGKDMVEKVSSLYAKACRSKSNELPKKLEELCLKGADVLKFKLQTEHFDTVVCTHVLASVLVAYVRRIYNNSVPNYFVSTEYTDMPGLGELHADVCFVPHGMLYGNFIRNNISADCLLATGLPLPSAYYEPVDRVAMKKKLGLPTEGKIVLVNCMGLVQRNTCKKLHMLSARLPQDMVVAVLCGKNEKLRVQLFCKQPKKRLILVGETPQAGDYISAADVYITPPVGLLVAEAMAKRVPTLLKGSLPGYERRNAAFLVERGVTQLAKDPKQAAEAVSALMKSPESAEPQLMEMDHIMPPIAAEQICRYILKREN